MIPIGVSTYMLSPAMWPFDFIGAPELIVIGIAAILLFGKRLPDIGRQLGKGLVEFKKGLRGMQEEITKAGEETDADTSDVSSAKLSADLPETKPVDAEMPADDAKDEFEKEPPA